MLDDFEQRFGRVELGPPEYPNHGKVLYERSGVSGVLVKRYSLEPSGWSLDANTGERAWRLDANRAFLPDGREIKPWVQAAPKSAPPPLQRVGESIYGAPISRSRLAHR